MKEIHAFPKIFTLGSQYIPNIFLGEVEVTEKVDGSQFDFGINEDGQLLCRSKGAKIDLDNPPKMFQVAVDYLLANIDKLMSLPKDSYFFCEYLEKPKHNVLKYTRAPKNSLVLFGYSTGDKVINSYDKLCEMASFLDIEVVPLLFRGTINGPGDIEALLEKESILGGAKVEGVVVKNYEQPAIIGNLVFQSFGKYVREDFKEQHKAGWGKEHTTGGKLQTYIGSFRTEARWLKAIQHLRDKNELVFEAKDIGKLMKEVQEDLEVEEKENIKEALYHLFIGDIQRRTIGGFPEFYKKYLLERSFESK